jgi:hypothetical protein
MSESQEKPAFSGPYKELLGELAELITWVEENHDLSFVKAGDNQVFAYGGDGNVAVFDETLWQGLVELNTASCTFAIKPGENGQVTVTSSDPDEKASKKKFKEAVAAIRHYYESRYLKAPQSAGS